MSQRKRESGSFACYNRQRLWRSDGAPGLKPILRRGDEDMNCRVLAVTILCVAGACAQDTSATKVQGIPPGAAGTLQRGVAGDLAPASTSNLIDHGGRVLPSSNIYYIWWGSQSAWPNDANPGLTALAAGLNGSNFMKDIFPQYMRGAGVSTGFMESLYDSSSAPPAHGHKTTT